MAPFRRPHDGQVVGHVDIVALAEQRVVARLPGAVEVVEHLGRDGVGGQQPRHALAARGDRTAFGNVEHETLQPLAQCRFLVDGKLVHVTAQGGCDERVLLFLQRAEQFGEIVFVVHSVQVVLIECQGNGIARQVVGGAQQALGQLVHILAADDEPSVAAAVVVGYQHGGMLLDGDGDRALGHVDRPQAVALHLVASHERELLRPSQSAAVGVFLRQGDVMVGGFHHDVGHAFLFHPHMTELLEHGLGLHRVENADQVVPGGIAVGVVVEILPQSVLQGDGAHLLLQFLHHGGCLVVDDVAIEQTGPVEVGQRLLYGMCAQRAVGLHGRRLVGLQEIQVVVDVGEPLA